MMAARVTQADRELRADELRDDGLVFADTAVGTHFHIR